MLYRGFPSKLHHEVPHWVETGALFHIRIALDRKNEQKTLGGKKGFSAVDLVNVNRAKSSQKKKNTFGKTRSAVAFVQGRKICRGSWDIPYEKRRSSRDASQFGRSTGQLGRPEALA